MEREFAKRLIDLWAVSIEFAPNEQFKDWDIKAKLKSWEKTFEVKRDFKSQDTGNIVLEIRCNNQPSGIFASKSDYIIYCLNDNEFYYQDRWELLYRLSDVAKYKTVWWDWDRAEMYVISKELLPLLFNKL